MNLCLSGGAAGSDLAWGKYAKMAGHGLIHYVFNGHKYAGKPDSLILSDFALETASNALKRASLWMNGAKFPTSSNFVNNLLQRNFFQIASAESIYAITTLENNFPKGGTAWAIVMANQARNKNIFLLDQETETWYHVPMMERDLGPDEIVTRLILDPIGMPPTPSGIYAGIGTRKLNSYGENSIRTLYGV